VLGPGLINAHNIQLKITNKAANRAAFPFKQVKTTVLTLHLALRLDAVPIRVRNPDYAAAFTVAGDYIVAAAFIVAGDHIVNRRLVSRSDVMPLLRKRGTCEHRNDAKSR
jgi:hypothetical protein